MWLVIGIVDVVDLLLTLHSKDRDGVIQKRVVLEGSNLQNE